MLIINIEVSRKDGMQLPDKQTSPPGGGSRLTAQPSSTHYPWHFDSALENWTPPSCVPCNGVEAPRTWWRPR